MLTTGAAVESEFHTSSTYPSLGRTTQQWAQANTVCNAIGYNVASPETSPCRAVDSTQGHSIWGPLNGPINEKINSGEPFKEQVLLE